QLSPSACQPSLADLRLRLPSGMPWCAKLAPGVPWPELSALGGEIEFVSLDGELKECVAWMGPYRTAARRATVLPTGACLTVEEHRALPQGCAAPGRSFYDPAPAVVRAGLVSDLARSLGVWQIDHEIAYLSADTHVPTPFARVLLVEESLPFHLGQL